MSYRELQIALKAFSSRGILLQCKLNGKKHILKQEYWRIINTYTPFLLAK